MVERAHVMSPHDTRGQPGAENRHGGQLPPCQPAGAAHGWHWSDWGRLAEQSAAWIVGRWWPRRGGTAWMSFFQHNICTLCACVSLASAQFNSNENCYRSERVRCRRCLPIDDVNWPLLTICAGACWIFNPPETQMACLFLFIICSS